jgi:hypothetical protein
MGPVNLCELARIAELCKQRPSSCLLDVKPHRIDDKDTVAAIAQPGCV